MIIKVSRIVVVLLLMVSIQAASADLIQVAEGLKIVDLQYQEHGNVHRIVLTANLPFMYQTLAAGRGTLVIEADKSDISQISPNYNTAASAVKNISVSNRLGSNGSEVTELIIKFDPSFSYTHSLKGRKLFVEFAKKGFENLTPAVSNGNDEATNGLVADSMAEPEADNTSRNKPAKTSQAKSFGLVDINIDRRPEGTRVVFAMNENVSMDSVKTISLGSPPRYVLDMHGARNFLSNKHRVGDDTYFSKIRTAQFAVEPRPIARAVFDLNGDERPAVTTEGNNVVVTFGVAQPKPESNNELAAVNPEVKEEQKPEVAVEDPAPAAKEDVAENDSTEASEDKPVDIKPVSLEPLKTEEKAEEPVISKPVAQQPLANKADSTANKIPSESLINKNNSAPAEKEVKPAVKAEEYKVDESAFKDQFPDDMKASGSNNNSAKQLDINNDAFQDEEAAQDQEPADQDVKLVASASGKGEFETKDIVSFEQKYTGHPVSLDFSNIALRDLIGLLGQMTKKNFMLDPSVRNQEVSLYVTEMPWDQALDLLLDQYNLGKEEEGNVIHIATQERLTEKAQQKRKLAEERALAVPVRQITKPINYAKANDLLPLIRRNLSRKGAVVVDARTNTIVITDIPSKVDAHLNLIQALDVPTKQVVVEARVVETTRDFVNEFGLQYGFKSSNNSAYGNSTGLVFPNQLAVGGGLTSNVPSTTTPMAIDVPASTQTVGILGSFGNISGSFGLDILLSAAETDKKVRVLSRPRISAANNTQAIIKSGVEVPFQVVQNNTVSIRWREATLKLEVTPHITADDTVIMDVKVDKSSLGIQTIAGYAIQTRQATSTIRVKDGGVAVIGGVLEVSEGVTENAVPVLGKLPLLGRLFRSTQERTQNTELLIFISPKIIG